MSIKASMEELLGAILEELHNRHATDTELLGHLRGLIVNDVLLVATRTFDTNGIVSEDFPTPYGSVQVTNHSPATTVVVSADPPQSSPPGGAGTNKVPPWGSTTLGLHGRALTLYGTAGEQVSLQVSTRVWPPLAVQAGLIGAASADAAAATTFAEEVLGLLNPAGTIDRARAMGAAADGLGVLLASQPGSTAPAAAAPAVNTAAVITFAAVAGQSHRLTFLVVSYNAAPTGGRLTVADGATNLVDMDVTAAGPLVVPLPPGGIKGSVNTAMTITLAAAGAAVSGKVSAAKLTA